MALVNIPIWNQYVDFLVDVLDELASLFHSAGLGIIAFTIIVKTLMLPLTVQALRSSKAMQELQPKIKELQKKHGNDRQRISQETMALYQQYRVNPDGRLPADGDPDPDLPRTLQRHHDPFDLRRRALGSGVPVVAQPGPPRSIHLLPIVAGIFQFVQTQMMRPANQPKSTDPQQAMMNSVMNIMPLTVVFFGWNFAAGPVLYWATQSIYSVVQQWFITGWGNLSKWAPFLPELPEHRRLGYRPPRDLDDVVVVSGDGQPVYGPGPMGWLQRKMDEAQQQALTANGGSSRQTTPAATARLSCAAKSRSTAVSRAAGNGTCQSRSRNGKGKKAEWRTGSFSQRHPHSERENGATVSAPAGAVIVPRKAKPVSRKRERRVRHRGDRLAGSPQAWVTAIRCDDLREDNRWISGE